MRQPKHAKKSFGTFSVCSGTSQTAIETRIRRCRADMQSIMDMHCRAQTQIQDIHAARTMKAKIDRAAAILYGYSPNRLLIVWFLRHVIFESEYMREGAVTCLSARPRDNAVCAFRSLFARLPSKPKKFSELFRMFQLAEHSPREAVRRRIEFG